MVWHPCEVEIDKVIWYLNFSGEMDSGKVLIIIISIVFNY